MQKVRLKKEVVQELLKRQEYIGKLADTFQVQSQTIIKQLLGESPKLCSLPYVNLIKDILSTNKDLVEFYYYDEVQEGLLKKYYLEYKEILDKTKDCEADEQDCIDLAKANKKYRLQFKLVEKLRMGGIDAYK